MEPESQFLHYRIIGRDSPSKLIFLHGVMGQGRNWASIAKKFSSEHQCLIFDQRGHGHSMKPEKGYDMDSMACDLGHLLSELGWQKPVKIVGHSMGGRVALGFSRTHPHLLERLVLVDTSPRLEEDIRMELGAMLDFIPTPFSSRKEASEFMNGKFLNRYPDEKLRDFFYSNLVNRGGQYDWIFSKSAVHEILRLSSRRDCWKEYKELRSPTLLIRGNQSKHLSLGDFKKVLAENSHLQGIGVEGAGHWVHAEKPLETISIMENFFKEEIPHGG